MINFEEFLGDKYMDSLLGDEIREDYIQEQYGELLEKLITVGGKAYPKFGNIVIMAGGAGSGKGFVKSELLGVEGYTFDVDVLKSMAAKAPLIQKRVKKELGADIAKLSNNLKKPENVSKLHEIIGDYLNLDDRKAGAFYKSVFSADPERKPNIIFDVTLKDLRKLEKLARQAAALGYSKENIHIVWVVNDIEIAKQQNAKRARVVPTEILVNTHRGAANTMGDIMNMGKSLKKYMDGDIVFAFNKVGVDTDLVKSKNTSKESQKKRGRNAQYIKASNYFYVKRKGKAPIAVKNLDKDIKMKIRNYVPKGVDWK